jgi:hypothetical protein
MPQYQLVEHDPYEVIEAADVSEALQVAIDNVDASNYDVEETLWIDVRVYNIDDEDDASSATVTLNPDEPPCSDDESHDWQSPFEIVGGIKENPGVWGHGGGVVITECCTNCGCARVTDTWAQRRDTGEQGLRSVSYEEGRFSEDLATGDEEAAE